MKMVKVSTADLVGAPLDWAVAKALGLRIELRRSSLTPGLHPMVIDSGNCGRGPFHYSTDWSHGGLIIERERIAVVPDVGAEWLAAPANGLFPGGEIDARGGWEVGPTPLIAAMRAFVASKIGDEVEVPA